MLAQQIQVTCSSKPVTTHFTSLEHTLAHAFLACLEQLEKRTGPQPLRGTKDDPGGPGW